jgi:hypothetical protein
LRAQHLFGYLDAIAFTAPSWLITKGVEVRHLAAETRRAIALTVPRGASRRAAG